MHLTLQLKETTGHVSERRDFASSGLSGTHPKESNGRLRSPSGRRPAGGPEPSQLGFDDLIRFVRGEGRHPILVGLKQRAKRRWTHSWMDTGECRRKLQLHGQRLVNGCKWRMVWSASYIFCAIKWGLLEKQIWLAVDHPLRSARSCHDHELVLLLQLAKLLQPSRPFGGVTEKGSHFPQLCGLHPLLLPEARSKLPGKQETAGRHGWTAPAPICRQCIN